MIKLFNMCNEISEEELKKIADRDNDPAFKENVKRIEKELEERYSKLRKAQEERELVEILRRQQIAGLTSE